MEEEGDTIDEEGLQENGDFEEPSDIPTKNRKKLFFIIIVIVVLLAAILASVIYFMFLSPESEEKEEEAELTSDNLHKADYPGETIEFDFTVYNLNAKQDVFSPSVSGLPSDWVVILPDSITVEGKESKQEFISVIPSSATALNKTYSFTFKVTSKNINQIYTLEYKLTVLRTYGVELFCPNNSKDAFQGKSLDYSLVINNNGNAEDTITLTYNQSQLPSDWSISFESDSMNVPALSSEAVTCTINTHSNSPLRRYDITVIATSEGGKSDLIWLNTTLHSILITDTPHRQGYPDEELFYNFTINNPENEDDVFSPQISGLPSDWIISMPTTISVDGDKSNKTGFSITPSLETAVNKTYIFMLNIASANTQDTYIIGFKLTVFRLSYGVALLCYNNSHDADSGRSTYYAIVVNNTGNGEDTISFSHEFLPSNWIISFEYNPIIVDGYSSEVVIINITTHPGTSKGRFDVKITATSSGGPTACIWLNTSTIKDFEFRVVMDGDKIQVNYIGTLVDGSILNTSYSEVANNDDYPKSEFFTLWPSYSPLKVQVGAMDPEPSDEYMTVIEGFWEAVLGLKVNETTVVRIPPEKGYNYPGYPLYGETLIFEITVVSIDN
ncbi:MAG: FKBP-type peptidyl-prolyl cis-trans isomerase [Thermoplasmata archaeon]|nr:MAG: FKBP-type peptidyl-prolyl cis-trans isomerase [Thermoplasmata archaeon]